MKFLVTLPDSFGDIVLRQPLLAGLVAAGHNVAALVRRSYAQILPFLEPELKVILMEDLNPYTPEVVGRRPDIAPALDEARAFAPDALVIAPYQRTMMDLWVLDEFTAIPSYGFKGVEVGYEGIIRKIRPCTHRLTHEVAVPGNLLEIEKNRRLLSMCLGREIAEYVPSIRLPETIIRRAKSEVKRLGLKQGTYAVCTPATTSLPLKQYPPDRIRTILRYWAETWKRPILLTANPHEEQIALEISKELHENGITAPVWVGGAGTIDTLLGLLINSKVYFGIDTGTMHFSAALGRPVLAIFGGGHWPRFVPAARQGATVLQDLPCFSCGWECLFRGNALCVGKIDPAGIREMIDDFESGKITSFEVRSSQFGDTMMNSWIEEAKSVLQMNRQEIILLGSQGESAHKEYEKSTARERELQAEVVRLEESYREQEISLGSARAELETRERSIQLLNQTIGQQGEQLQLLQAQLRDEKKNSAGIQSDADELRSRLQAREQEVEQLNSEISGLKQENKHLGESLSGMEQEKLQFIGRVSKLEQENALCMGQVAKLEQEKVLFIGQISKLEQEKALFIGQISKLEQVKALFIGQISKLEQEKALFIGQIAELGKEKHQLAGQVAVLQKNLADLQKVSADTASRLDEKIGLVARLESDCRDRESKIGNLEHQNRSLKSESEKQLADLRTASSEVKQQLEGKISELTAGNGRLQARIQSLESDCEVLRGEKTELEEQNSMHRRVISGSLTALRDMKPVIEELHLAIRQQDELLQSFEGGLAGAARSGWIRLGLLLRIPWLSRWYRMMYEESSSGHPVVKKPEMANPLDVKWLVAEKVDHVAALLSGEGELGR